MDALHPRRLALRQLEMDRERTRRFPDLFAHKIARMNPSPLAFLRGASPLFYEILALRPDLADGPAASGWIVGDAHLENFGAFRPFVPEEAGSSHQKSVSFDLNDLDDAVEGPWRWDVLRLTTSLILGGRELGVSGAEVLRLASTLIESHVSSAFSGASLPARPRPVAALMHQVEARSRKDLLDDRTVVERGQRRFVRGARYRTLLPELEREVTRAFASYAARLPREESALPEQLEVVDTALRIAGTGSLGALRVAVLTRGKGGPDGGWVFDMKEEVAPSAARAFGLASPPVLAPSSRSEAERVVTACRACLEFPPRMLATSVLGSSTVVVRRLAPQEDKLDLRKLDRADLPALAGFLGSLLGSAHARGSRRRPDAAWTPAEQAELLERAVLCAGLHEAAYLAFCLHSRTAGDSP